MKLFKRKLTLILLPICFGAMTVSGQIILQQWNFEDPDGTSLTNATNSGIDSADWSSTADNLEVFDGALRLAGDVGGNKNGTFVDPESYGVADSPTGIFSFEAVFGGWDLSAFDTKNRTFSVALRSGSNNLARFAVAYTGTGVNLNVFTQGTLRTSGDNFSNNVETGLAITSSTTYTFRADVDFNEGSVTHYLNGSQVGLVDDLTASDLGGFQLGAFPAADFDNAAAFVDLDSMTLTAIPEPSTYAAFLGLAALSFIVIRRRIS